MVELENVLGASTQEPVLSRPQMPWSSDAWSPAWDLCWDWGGASIPHSPPEVLGIWVHVCCLCPPHPPSTSGPICFHFQTINHLHQVWLYFVDLLRSGAKDRVIVLPAWSWPDSLTFLLSFTPAFPTPFLPPGLLWELQVLVPLFYWASSLFPAKIPKVCSWAKLVLDLWRIPQTGSLSSGKWWYLQIDET